MSTLTPIEEALADFAAGQIVIVVDTSTFAPYIFLI